MLQLKDIKFSYTNSWKEKFSILDGVNLSVSKGEVIALIGGNGVGKTTLFNIVSGIQKDFKGNVVYEGKDISKLQPHTISQLGIGRLFQGRQIMEDLTLLENFKIASSDMTGEIPLSCFFLPKQIRQKEAEKAQQACEILKKIFGENCKYLRMMSEKGSAFSYGEQRMLAIARLLMGRNKLLLLDEPTSGINPVYNKQLGQIIRKLVEEQGLTIFMIEHNMHFVQKIADRCAFLTEGKIVSVGKTVDVLSNQYVRNSYLGI